MTILSLHVGFLLILLGEGYRAETITASARTIEPPESSISAEAPGSVAPSKAVPTQVSSRVPTSRTVAPVSRPVALPGLQPASGQSPATAGGSAETVHIVKSGDTLNGLARTYGCSTQAIRTANGLSSDRLTVGAKLKIPR